MGYVSFIEKIESIRILHRVLIFVATILVLGGLFAFLFYVPKTGEISRTEKEIAGLKLKIAQAKVQTKKLAKLEADFAETEAKFQEALKLLPKKSEIPSLLRKITQLGLDSHLEFKLFSPQGEKVQDFYVEIPVAIQVTGKYHDVAVFFDKVGRMKRIVNILDVSLQPKQALSTILNVVCTAVTYRFKGD